MKVIDVLMTKPFFYRLVQITLAGGGHEVIKKYLIRQVPKTAKKILDQGCGIGEYSLLFKDYTGIDNSREDIEYAQRKYPGKFVCGSATKMPFRNNSFDVTFAVGLHHHLSDRKAKKAIAESLRVTKRGGKVIIIDAMLPKTILNIPGLVLRKLDRGKFVRRYSETLNLMPEGLLSNHLIISSPPFDYIVIEVHKV